MTPTRGFIAGPNGAGKSTSAPALLSDRQEVMEFVNADDIAKGLSAFHPDRVAVAAGKILLKRFRELAESKQSLAIETTLSGRGYAAHIRQPTSIAHSLTPGASTKALKTGPDYWLRALVGTRWCLPKIYGRISSNVTHRKLQE